MKKESKIYVAGHNGLVGSSIIRELEAQGFINLITRNHEELDLVNQQEVNNFFEEEKPEFVILAAAKVGGIHANNLYPADFIYNNLMIESNVIHSAYKNNVKRLLFLGSSCVYPKSVKQPIREDSLLTNVLESTNEPYAIAKIAGIKLCESYNRQYDTDFRSVMPTNLYGINDNFHPENSHVIPALLQRFHKAKISNKKEEVVWGTGEVRREFLFVEDMASASLFIIKLDKNVYRTNIKPMQSHINIGSGEEITIKSVAELIKKIVGFEGDIKFDTTKPDGPDKKLVDISLLTKMGWQHRFSLEEGLKKTYEWYLMNAYE